MGLFSVIFATFELSTPHGDFSNVQITIYIYGETSISS